ncbi:MAG: trypsin-like peptidase domain-containing protein [Planctomycetota bacterium]|jgi:S1-C subfamily serine protease
MLTLRRTVCTVALAALCAAPAWADEESDRADVAALQGAVQSAIARVRPAYIMVQGGSGVVISPDGWALTNHHVVSTSPMGSRMRVQMPPKEQNGTPGRYWATLHSQDILGDIALLKIDAPEPLPYAELGDSDAVKVGQSAIALGNPFSYIQTSGEPTVTIGIISANHRYQGGYSDCIQTDAALNPGNSGGPLFTLDGKVIGINGRVGVRFGNRISTGVGYAIAANQIRAFMPAFRRGGPVYHGFVGGLGLDDGAETQGRGAKVGQVIDRSSAAFAGFKPGDLVVEAGGRRVWNANRLNGIIGSYPAFAEVAFVVERTADGAPTRVTLRCWLDSLDLEERSPNSPWLGVIPGDGDGRSGFPVEGVSEGSPAQAAGIRAGDTIVKFGGTPILAPYHMGDALAEVGPRDAVPVVLRRADGSNATVTVNLKPRGPR